jgi:hypothetical protein
MMPPRPGIERPVPPPPIEISGKKEPKDMKGYHYEYQYRRKLHSRLGKKKWRPTLVPNDPQNQPAPVKK